ncbi:hypothetical protein [Hyphomicrobium sp.]|uniref:hypothetical protein n=1 Tax=Hyphomicrobium sp. TaxID=82 RepID=UPI00356A90F9
MTLVLAAISKEAIWVVADRRLSQRGRALIDDACKIMFLETTDGIAILSYAGLGRTIAGVQPSEWMSAVVRGRNLPLEQTLGLLAEAMQRELPKHLLRFPPGMMPSHTIIAPAFVDDEPRLYILEVVLSADRKQKSFRFVRQNDAGGRKPPLLAVAGSGGMSLFHRRKYWMRPLMRIVRAYDRSRVSAQTVANHMATLNNDVHAVDVSVGPRSIVAWRNRKSGIYKGGGAQEFFNNCQRQNDSMIIPTIASGMDVRGIVQVLWDDMMKGRFGLDADYHPNTDEINAKIATLPHGPDESLP